MYFRFGSALVLVLLIALAGIALEKRNLELRRGLARQRFQMDVLQEAYVRVRLKTQRLASPARVSESLDPGGLDLDGNQGAGSRGPTVNDE